MENNNDYDYDQNKLKEKGRNRKLFVPMIIAVVTMIALTVGATYAYITVKTTNSFGNPTITGTVPSIGSATIAKVSDLTLTLSRPQLMMPDSDTAYYATANGGDTTSSTEQTIATVSITGDGTFTCNYTINVTATGTLFSKWVGKDKDILTFSATGGTGPGTLTHDFSTAWEGTKTLTGTLTGLTSEAPQNITAQLKYVNSTTVDQSELNNDTGTITFTLGTFTCLATA